MLKIIESAIYKGFFIGALQTTVYNVFVYYLDFSELFSVVMLVLVSGICLYLTRKSAKEQLYQYLRRGNMQTLLKELDDTI